MKSLITTTILVMVSLAGFSQNYQCIDTSGITYFTNANHYLRGIRIDSTLQSNGHIFLFPYKTARGSYFSSRYDNLKPKGSWLGDTIIVAQDGTYNFTNHRNDTIVIKSLAKVNDSWVFYDDTSNIYFEATVSKIDTMSINGTLDSIKTITLTAKDPLGTLSGHRFSNKNITLSKKHGFITVFDLYIFPQLGTPQSFDGYDYFSYRAGDIMFNQIALKNPQLKEIYDFNIGDVFHYKNYYIHPNAFVVSNSSNTVLNKVNLNPFKIRYTIQEVYQYYEYPSYQYPQGRKVTKLDTFNKDVDTTLLLDLQLLPEEWGMTREINYNPVDTVLCITNPKFDILPNFVSYNDTLAESNTFEPCSGSTYYTYKIGLGQIYYARCDAPSAGAPNPTQTMFYWHKKGVSCGKPYDLSIEKTANPKRITLLYPNPATTEIIIHKDDNIDVLSLRISDITGRIVHKQKCVDEFSTINVSKFPTGMYQVTTYNKEGYYDAKILSIIH